MSPAVLSIALGAWPAAAAETPHHHAPLESDSTGAGAIIEMPGGVQVMQIPAVTDTATAMPRIHLAWGAPWGEAGARDHIAPACGDTAAIDTLYLSLDPVADRPQFVGWLATLYFRAAPGDTLRSHWRYTTGGPGRSPVTIEVADARTAMAGEVAWSEVQAFGGGYWDHTPSSARLRMVAAVDVAKAPSIQGGRRYTLARVLVRRPQSEASGCGAPLCVELATVQGTFSAVQGEPEPLSNVGPRFVRYQDPRGLACDGARAPRTPAQRRLRR